MKLLTLFLAASLVGAGCGARFDNKQKDALRAINSGRAASNGDVTGGDQTATGGEASGATDGGTGAASSSGGDASATGGGGGASAGGTGGAATASGECAGDKKGFTEVGVTDNQVTIGNVSIISGAVPGFGKTSQSAVRAYVNYINSQGGVCGRQLKLVTSDDRFDGGANRSETEKLKSQVFGFVGGLSVVDDGGAGVLQGTNIPDVGLSLSDARIKMANNFSPSPIDIPDGGNGFVPALTYYKSQGAQRGAVIWPSQPIARERAQGYVKDMQRAGIDVVYTAEVSVTETNYSGHAAQIQQKKADVLVTTLEVSGMASLAKALKQQGYQPKYASYGPQAYGKQFLKLAGDAAEGVTLNLAYDIFEGRANNKAMDTFLTWFGRTAPGTDPDFFAVLAWSSAELFVKALKAAGNKTTRDAVLGELKKINSFDAGGILAPIDPAAKHWAKCFVIVKATGGQWKRVEPAGTGFHC